MCLRLQGAAEEAVLAMPDKSKQRTRANAAFEAATSDSRKAQATEAESAPDKTSKLKELRLQRDAEAEALKRKQS